MPDPLSSDLASLRIRRNVAPAPRPYATVLLIALLVAGIGAGIYLVALPQLTRQIFKVEVALTEIAAISPMQASITVTSTGYVVPQTLSKVGAKMSGRIAHLAVKEGDTVKAGDLLAQLEASDQKSAIAAATSRVLVARAQADTARANLADIAQQIEREKILVDHGAMGRASLEDMVAKQRSFNEQVKAADAQARAAQSEVDTLRTNLEGLTIVAPIGGTVISKPAEVGEMVGPLSVPVAEIADFKSLLVETDVPEGRLHLIHAGSPAEIVLDAYPEKRYRGATAEFSQRVNRAKATVTVKVRFVDTLEGVLPDMAARVSFLSQEIAPDALNERSKTVVPANALADRGGAKVVFVVDGGKLHMVPVTVGAPVGTGLELVSGPPPGTKVVSNPATDLRDGQEIKEKT